MSKKYFKIREKLISKICKKILELNKLLNLVVKADDTMFINQSGGNLNETIILTNKLIKIINILIIKNNELIKKINELEAKAKAAAEAEAAEAKAEAKAKAAAEAKAAEAKPAGKKPFTKLESEAKEAVKKYIEAKNAGSDAKAEAAKIVAQIAVTEAIKAADNIDPTNTASRARGAKKRMKELNEKL